MSDKRLSEETLQEIVRRIVEVAQPEKIILFGSAARGEMRPHSDVDLLVIKRYEEAIAVAEEAIRWAEERLQSH